jgi:hypothetical protein
MNRDSIAVRFLIVSVLAAAAESHANQVPNPAVTASARPFNASYNATNLFDSLRAEFASQSQGVVSTPFTTDPANGTWVELDFGAPAQIDQFVMVARPNNVDVIETSRLIVSTDAVFDATDTIFTFNPSGTSGQGFIQNVTPVTGQYARWEVLTRTGSGLNLGALQMYFLDIPEGHVLLPAPVAINSSTPFNASFVAANAVNGNAGDGNGNEYASQGAGASMFIDFDFGVTIPISGFDFWNRVLDRVTTFELDFADTADFSSPIATLPFTASANGNEINSATFEPVQARYVRFRATGFEGVANTGMREIQFYTPAGQPPLISRPLQGATRLIGDSFSFAVSAGGDQPLFYQWLHEGSPVAGATNASLVLTNLQVSQSGNYSVVVTNFIGSVTSAPALLVVTNPPLDITSDLRAWYKLDETTFLIASDSTPNVNHATLQGFPDDDSQWVPGRINGGLRFTAPGLAGNEVALAPDTGLFDFSANPEFTLAAWVRGSPAQDNGAALIAKGTGGGGEQYAVDVLNGTFRFFVRGADGAAIAAQSPTRINDTWQHVVAVYSRTLNRMKLYVNTVEVGSITPLTTDLLAQQHELSIGARKGSAAADYNLNLNGIMDDVRLYARALTPRDITALYGEATPSAPVLVQHPLPGFAGVGDSVSFNVIVDGTVPLSYQWQKNGVAIPGATNATLAITNAQTTDAADYSVVVTNLLGLVTSTNAHLTVVPFLNLSSAPAQASSLFNATFPAVGAFDGLRLGNGQNTARWASATTGLPHWLYVDLGGELSVRRVALDWDPACGSNFTVRIHPDSATGPSPNPDDWTTIATVENYAQAGQGIDGIDQLFDFVTEQVFLPGNISPTVVSSLDTTSLRARYIMVHVTGTAPGFGHVSVWEMQIDAVPLELRVRSIALEAGGTRITFVGVPGTNYQVQRATAIDGQWSTLDTVAAGGDGVATYLDATPRGQAAFYRITAP